MELQVDLRVFELLASRLCHDLISPVGAIKSGLELFTEFGEDADGETMALINGSAEQASLKLQFFRIAYGQAGSQREGVKLKEAVSLLTAVCGSQRTSIKAGGAGDISGAGAGKLLLNMALIAAETIPRGGVVTIDAAGGTLQAAARGEGAVLDAEMADALSLATAVDALTPKTVQGYFTGMLAQRAGIAIKADTGAPDIVILTASLEG